VHDTSRSEQEIFQDLERLCASPGYVHALAFLCFRDNMVGFADKLELKDIQEMFSPDRLIRTETSTLLGLLVRSPIDFTIPSQDELTRMVERSDALLAEIHLSMSTPLWKSFRDSMASGQDLEVDFMSSGAALRETIFYSAESAYSFQYRDIAPEKYEADSSWLLREKGFTMATATLVADFLGKLVSQNLTVLVQPKVGNLLTPWACLSGFTFRISEIAQSLSLDSLQVQRIVDAFCLPSGSRNESFNSLGAFNATNATPIIRMSDDKYVLFQPYSLNEALYESPFYWMSADPHYRDTAMVNRGRFTEAFSYRKLTGIFGSRNVFQNLKLFDPAGDTAGEIDVLVLWGARAIVLQAKSKKLTLEARKGNDKQLQADFKMSVQNSYDQGVSCAELLQDETFKIFDASHTELHLDRSKLKSIYLFCVISEHYPALSFQSRQFLNVRQSDRIAPPFVMDIFTLDVMAEMLDSPLRFLSYVDKRTGYNEQLHAGHELTILALHLRQNLWIDTKYDIVSLDEDIAASLDLAMLVRRGGAVGDRDPEGILTLYKGTPVDQLIKSIDENPNPKIVDLGFMLLTLGGDSLEAINHGLCHVTQSARDDGKLHDFSLGIEGDITGITIHSTDEKFEVASPRLMTHCERRKYRHRAPTWFGICVWPADGGIRFGMNLNSPWVYDKALEAATSTLKRPSKMGFENGKVIIKKIGRNEPCTCGSGKKYKKCCLTKYT
jgi:hypothetical protein